MVLPRNTFTDLGPQDRAYVYDARTGRTVIEGYLENPTPVDGPDGQQYDVSAVGGMALASDETRALIYVDRDLDGWVQGQLPSSGTVGGQRQRQPGLRVQFPGGNVVATTSNVAAPTTGLHRAGMNLGAIRVEDYGGKVDAGYQLAAFLGAADTRPRRPTPPSPPPTSSTPSGSAPTSPPAPRSRTSAPPAHRGATNVADDTTWTEFDSSPSSGSGWTATAPC
jgi:hypothetical protein